MKGRILTIAGTDPSGGAGIQADIKTITALKGYAMTAVTALVAQNTTGVIEIVNVTESFVVQQIECVLDDIGVDAVKTGMLHTSGIIKVVRDIVLQKIKELPIIVDPVMVAKSGDILLQEDARDAVKNLLIPHAAVVTPNNSEAEILTGHKITNDDEAISAGKEIIDMGAAAVLMKGGHRGFEKIRDILIHPGGINIFESPRQDSRNTHGTGCTLSSAIAVGLGQKLDLVTAVQRAHFYVQEAIRLAPNFGKGNGPLNHVFGVHEI